MMCKQKSLGFKNEQSISWLVWDLQLATELPKQLSEKERCCEEASSTIEMLFVVSAMHNCCQIFTW